MKCIKWLIKGLLDIGHYATTEIQYVDRERVKAEIKNATKNGFAPDKANLIADYRKIVRKNIKE